MSSLISLTFSCSVCGYEIRGEYEEEDFDYPVFCPKCGRQNRLPALPTTSNEQPPDQATDSLPAKPEPHITKPIVEETVKDAVSLASKAPLASSPQVKPSDTPAPVTAAWNRAPAVAPIPAAPQPINIPSNNRIAWRFRPASSSRKITPVRNCVAVDGQNRIIAALGNEVVALGPGATGCEVDWKFSAADYIPGSPAIGPGRLTFVHSGDGLLHALDANGSSARPATKVGAALGWANPLIDDFGRVWISQATGGLIRVDQDGQTSARPFWRHSSRLDCTGAIVGPILYIGSEDQFVHSVDLQGARGRDAWNPQEKRGLTGWYINSAIAVDADNRIIAVSRDDVMHAFDHDGHRVWTAPMNGKAIGSPVIAETGVIIIGLTTSGREGTSMAGRLITIQRGTGRLAWSLDFDAPIESTPVIGDAGEVYVGDNAGKIHAVSIEGRRVWSEQVGSPVRSAGAIHSLGQVIFGLDDGSLVSLRCASRSLAGEWPKLLKTAANCSADNERSVAEAAGQ